MNIELLTKNFYHYTPLYSDSGKPVLFENDILKIQISLNKKAAEDQLASTELTEREQIIREMILQNHHISVDRLATEFSVNRRTILHYVSKMKNKIHIAFDKKKINVVYRMNYKFRPTLILPFTFTKSPGFSPKSIYLPEASPENKGFPKLPILHPHVQAKSNRQKLLNTKCSAW